MCFSYECRLQSSNLITGVKSFQPLNSEVAVSLILNLTFTPAVIACRTCRWTWCIIEVNENTRNRYTIVMPPQSQIPFRINAFPEEFHFCCSFTSLASQWHSWNTYRSWDLKSLFLFSCFLCCALFFAVRTEETILSQELFYSREPKIVDTLSSRVNVSWHKTKRDTTESQHIGTGL